MITFSPTLKKTGKVIFMAFWVSPVTTLQSSSPVQRLDTTTHSAVCKYDRVVGTHIYTCSTTACVYTLTSCDKIQ